LKLKTKLRNLVIPAMQVEREVNLFMLQIQNNK